MRTVLAAAVALSVSIAAPAAAKEVSLSGDLTQGGLVIGQTLPGAQVTLDGRAVRVGGDGTFLIGFGRDAAKRSILRVRHGAGGETVRPLDIKPRTYKISRIDGLPKRKVTPRRADMKRIREDNAKIGAVRRSYRGKADFRSGFAWPATGRISGIFGSQRILNGKPRRAHNGVDVAAPRGTPVSAMADGIIALVHEDMFFSGKTVMIDHGHGLSSVYIHMDSITARHGQAIRKGEKIGTIGMTGRTTGPHLHWGVNLFGMPLDPALLVPPMPPGK